MMANINPRDKRTFLILVIIACIAAAFTIYAISQFRK